MGQSCILRAVQSSGLPIDLFGIAHANLHPVATGDDVRMGLDLLRTMSRNEVVRLIMKASSEVMGVDAGQGD